MLNKNKIISILCSVIMISSVFSGCSSNVSEQPESSVSITTSTDESQAETSIDSEITSTATESSQSETETAATTSVTTTATTIEEFTETTTQAEEFAEQTDEIGDTTEYVAPIETAIDPDTVQTTPPVVYDSPIQAEITTTYAYNQLTSNEKVLYDRIYNAAINLQETVDVSGYTEDDWVKCFGNVYYQETELFWLDSYLEFGRLYYRTTDLNEIETMKESIANATTNIVSKVSALNNTVSRIKYIHDYLILSCDFEKEKGYNQTIYGGLVSGKMQCEGYAKTFTYLCNKIGIESAVITGNVESNASHAWNVVNVDGVWYNIDLTHDDPILETPNSQYIRYTYFLVPDAWIHNISHFRVNLSQTYNSISYFPVPACNHSDLNYFNYYDKVFTTYDEAYNTLLARVEEAIINRQPIVQIKVANSEIYSQVVNNLLTLKKTAESDTGISPAKVSKTCNDEQYIIGISMVY